MYINVYAELCRINEHQKVALDLDPYVKKLLNARRRVVLVNNILQNAQVSGKPWCGLLKDALKNVLTITVCNIKDVSLSNKPQKMITTSAVPLSSTGPFSNFNLFGFLTCKLSESSVAVTELGPVLRSQFNIPRISFSYLASLTGRTASNSNSG